MTDQFKNLMIGLFVTVAATIVIFMLMFLHPRIGDEGKILHVRFTDIDKVTPGTRVTYAGKPVGEVVDITEFEEGRRGPADEDGHVYLYDLKLRVDSNTQVYNTDSVVLRTSGLLGEKNIEITPIAPKPGQPLKLIDDRPIYGEETGSVEETFKIIKTVATKVDTALDHINEMLDEAQKQKLIDKITKTVENMESITASLNQPEDWKHILDDAKTIFDNAAQGKGTLGKLLSNDELYLRFNSIMSKLETTLDDINHYGLMFSSDKGWQRLRARRLNLMQQLRTPQEFRNYFNDEIDQISTSLSRVYMVLDSVNEDPYCHDLLDNKEYDKVFAELMRRVSMLKEEMQMYNTQVVESRVHETELGCPPLCNP